MWVLKWTSLNSDDRQMSLAGGRYVWEVTRCDLSHDACDVTYPPVDRMTHRHLWKYYLPATTVASGKNWIFTCQLDWSVKALPFITQLELLSPGCTRAVRNIYGRLSETEYEHVIFTTKVWFRYNMKKVNNKDYNQRLRGPAMKHVS